MIVSFALTDENCYIGDYSPTAASQAPSQVGYKYVALRTGRIVVSLNNLSGSNRCPYVGKSGKTVLGWCRFVLDNSALCEAPQKKASISCTGLLYIIVNIGDEVLLFGTFFLYCRLCILCFEKHLGDAPFWWATPTHIFKIIFFGNIRYDCSFRNLHALRKEDSFRKRFSKIYRR